MHGFRIVGPQILLHVIVTQTGIWKALLAAANMWEFHRIAHEEDWRLVANQVVIAIPAVIKLDPGE